MAQQLVFAMLGMPNPQGVTVSEYGSQPGQLVTPRPLHTIAAEIERTWSKVNYAARPYLDAMHALQAIGDTYGCDSAKSVVLYFLSNATSWRGDDARRIKAELKSLAGLR